MKTALTKKAGPLPVWAWGLIFGGTIGAVLLVKKGKTAKPAEAEIPQTVAGGSGGPEVLGGAGSGSGGGTVAAGGETKSPSPEGLATQPTIGYEAGGFAREANDVLEGAEALQRLGLLRAPAPGANTSSAQAPAAARARATGGNPRAGLPFKNATIHGQHAHEYEHRVPGGVGPGGRFIVLAGPAKKTHAAKPSHAPPHAKGKAQPKHPTRSTHQPAAHHAPAKPLSHGASGIGTAHKPPARKPAKPAAKRKRR